MPEQPDHAPDRPNTPGLTERAAVDRRERLAREAAALRGNLHKRKQQARARAAASAEEGASPTPCR